MRSRASAVLRLVGGTGLGALLGWLVFRNYSWQQLEALAGNLEWGWLLAGLAAMFVSHIVRTFRWQQLLEASGNTVPFSHAFAALMTGYLVNYGVPRLGEAMRVTLLYRTQRVPITRGAGTVLVDRTADVAVLLLLLAALAVFEAPLLARLLAERGIGSPGQILALAAGIAVFGVLCAVVFWQLRHRLQGLPVVGKLFLWLEDTLKSVFSLRKLKRPGLFGLWTLVIWGGYWLSTEGLLRSAGLGHGIGFSLLLTVLGAVGMALPSPGGIGSFHGAILLGFLAHGYPQQAGIDAGLVLHTSQLLATAVVGLLCYLFLVSAPRKPLEPTYSSSQVT